MAIARQKILIGAAHRPLQQPILDRAAIDKHELHLGIATVQCRHPGIAGQADAFALCLDLKGIVLKLAAHNCAQPFQTRIKQIAFAGRVIQDGFVVIATERKANIRPRHGQSVHDFARIHLFGPRGFQKLQTRGRGIEKIAHLDPRAIRMGRRFRFAFGPAFDRQRPGIFRPAHPAGQSHPRDRPDGWQGFTAKAHETDIKQIIIGQF